MAKLIIRATDTAAALDEVMRRLGPDALIIATRHSEGMVEVTAAPAEVAPATVVTTSFEAHLLHRKGIATQTTGGGAEVSVSTHQEAPSAPGLQVMPPHLPRRLFLTGPPGAGVSMLAARLAAESLRLPAAPRPALVSPRQDLLAPPDRLRGWARLLGLVVDAPYWPPGPDVPVLPPPFADQCQIVDLSGLGAQPPDRLAALAATEDAALWLVMPTGLTQPLQDAICAPLAGVADALVLTRADLWPVSESELLLSARHGIPLVLVAQGTGLLDGLQPAPQIAEPGAVCDVA